MHNASKGSVFVGSLMTRSVFWWEDASMVKPMIFVYTVRQMVWMLQHAPLRVEGCHHACEGLQTVMDV